MAVNDTASTNRNTTILVDVVANDTDSDYLPLGVTGVSSVSGGTATVSGTGVQFVPSA